MSTRIPVEKATFTPQTGSKDSSFQVHFNPVSLQFSVSNTLKEGGRGKRTKQYTTRASGKLTMDLIFDNTADGNDVRLATSQIAALMEPAPAAKGTKKDVPSVVLFEWGSYKFQGVLESYKETLDFFSAEGVPLRASVNITMVEQDIKFPPSDFALTDDELSPDAVDVPSEQFSPTEAASTGGNPDAARGIAALNGAASLRFSAGASLAVTASVTLQPPVAFATSEAGIGIGAGASIGISAGAGIGIGAGANGGLLGASAGAGAGVSAGALFGASASAGVSASAGAFSGLRVSTAPQTRSVDTGRFLQVSESVPLSINSGDFAVSGQALTTGSAGLSAEVGANVDLRARIRFEVD